jgi:uncharacterized membrane protein
MQATEMQTKSYPHIARWAGLAAGGALALYGLSRRSRTGVGLAILGANVAFHSGTQGRYLTPLLQRLPLPLPASWTDGHTLSEEGVTVEHAVTVNRPADELYRYWRKLENLSQIMRHLESVTVIDDRRSHWVARGPIGLKAEWDAEITVDPPAGKLGAAFARIFGEDPATQIREDLRRFKQVMETSEIPTTRGQSSSRPMGR